MENSKNGSCFKGDANAHYENEVNENDAKKLGIDDDEDECKIYTI
jgi:hypothetical protein